MKFVNIFFGIILLPQILIGQSGTIDKSFNETGEVQLPGAYDVLVEPDGKILVKGEQITRLRPDGSIETQLNDFPDPRIEKLTDKDGRTIKISVISIPNPYEMEEQFYQYYTETLDALLVRRYNVDGSIDLTFGDGGKVIIDGGGAHWELHHDTDAIILDDGSIIIVSTAFLNYSDNGFTIIHTSKLSSDGVELPSEGGPGDGYLDSPTIYKLKNDRYFIFSRDNSYGTINIYSSDGQTYGYEYDAYTSPEGNVYGIVEQADGKVIIGVNINYGSNDIAWKFNTDGTFDESFGVNGKLIDQNFYGNSIAIQPDNQLLFAGSGKVKRYNNYIDTELEVNNRTETYGSKSFKIETGSNSKGKITFSNNSANVVSVDPLTGEVNINGIGTAIVEASQEQWGGYSPTKQSSSITIKKAPLTATAENKTRVYGEENPEFTVTYSGFVYNENENDITAPVLATSARINSDVGTYPIVIGGGAADNYEIILVEGTLTINKATQKITLPTVSDREYGDDPFEIIAESSSGLPVSYEVVSGPVTISENIITLTGPGLVTIKSFLEGDKNHLETSENISFCSNPPKPEIDYQIEDSELISSSTSGNQWFRNEEAINGATNQVLKIDLPGLYSVNVSVNGCSNISEAMEINELVTSAEDDVNGRKLSVYPVPTNNVLNVKINGTNYDKAQVKLLSMQGEILASQEMHIQLDYLQSEFLVDAMPMGIYILRVELNDKLWTRKFVKE